jgi:ABC-2 type transport system ATP-binding protein
MGESGNSILPHFTRELLAGRGVHFSMDQEQAGGDPPVLEARALTKRYGGFRAVREVSFSIRPGELLGVVGPNGAGKSTIVRMLTGLAEPTSGSVLFRGEPISRDLEAYKRSLGYVPETPDLYGFLTGWEYLEMVATLRGLERHRFRRKAEAMLDGLTLFPHRHNLIAGYSKGMRQRIVVISALLDDPALLILDEPFSGLDVTSALVLRRLIGMLARAGKAILFSSPVLEQVDQLCSHLLLLRHGATVASGTMEEMRAGSAGRAGELSLETRVMQLTEQVDAGEVAKNLLDAAMAPSR